MRGIDFEKPKLELVYDREKAEAEMSSMERFFCIYVSPAIGQLLVDVENNPDSDDNFFVLPFPKDFSGEDELRELDEIVWQHSQELIVFRDGKLKRNGRNIKSIPNSRILLYLSVGYFPVYKFIITTHKSFDNVIKENPVAGGVYVAVANKFIDEKERFSQTAKTAFEIADEVAAEYGNSSGESIAINNIIALLRDLLYGGLKLGRDERRAKFLELVRLRMMMGERARRVIEDCLGEYHLRHSDESEDDFLPEGTYGPPMELIRDLPDRIRITLIKLWKMT